MLLMRADRAPSECAPQNAKVEFIGQGRGISLVGRRRRRTKKHAGSCQKNSPALLVVSELLEKGVLYVYTRPTTKAKYIGTNFLT